MPSKSLLTLYNYILCTYLSLSYLLQLNMGLYLCHQPTTNSPTTVYGKEQSGRSLKLTTRLQVNFFLQICKFLMFFISTFIIMVFYIFLLLESFKLETRFINIQQGTLAFTDLIPVEQISKKYSILFQGPRIWNSLPFDIKNSPSFTIFKRERQNET